MAINQAVVFTKPVHHLGIDLSPAQLDQQTRAFLGSQGFNIVLSKRATGSQLAEREVIRQHYLMYSKASYGEYAISDEGRKTFKAAFGKEWDDEVGAGRIMDNPRLIESKELDVHELFKLWIQQFSTQKTCKVQAGVIVAWLPELDVYCINAFYPAMEANFNHPTTLIDYYVVEFDPTRISWMQFRKTVLGATDASRAAADSFRGRLYAEYPVDFPGRDNFVHGSAGPLEGFIERVIHEPDFDMATNPVGQYLAGRGVTLSFFNDWKSNQSITRLGNLFDATEEKNTDEIFPILEKVNW